MQWQAAPGGKRGRGPVLRCVLQYWRRPKTELGEQPILLFFCAAEDKE